MSSRIAFTEDINNPTMNAVRKYNASRNTSNRSKQSFSTAPRGQNASQPQEVSETYIPPVHDPTSTTTAIIVVIIIVVIIILAGWLIYTCCTPACDAVYEKEIEFYGGEGDVCPKCGKCIDGEDCCKCSDEEDYLEGGVIRRKRAVRAARLAKAAKKIAKAKRVVKARKVKKLAKAKAIVKAAKAAKVAKAAKKANVAKAAKVAKAVKVAKRKMDDNSEYFENLI